MIANLAAQNRCTIRVPPIERRVYFTRLATRAPI
jgi:hypothetical protein